MSTARPTLTRLGLGSLIDNERLISIRIPTCMYSSDIKLQREMGRASLLTPTPRALEELMNLLTRPIVYAREQVQDG